MGIGISGNAWKRCCSAGGPPVEQPIAISSMSPILCTAAGACPSSTSAIRARTFSIRTLANWRTLSIRSRWISSRRGETFPPGLVMKSIAPRSSALKTLRSLDFDETAITGVGRFCISHRRNEKPSITGISRSSVMTSGECLTTCLIASSPLFAVATTWISPSDSSIFEIVTRL